MKKINEPMVITPKGDNPSDVIDETREELNEVFKKQKTGFMGFLSRLFGWRKDIDQIENEMNEEMEKMKKEFQSH